MILSHKEKQWCLEQRITRLTDNKEVLIYPMGAERYLSLILTGKKKGHYDIHKDIKGKNLLIIPGYGNSVFLFAQAGAASITVYDKDPVTIAWIKAFKKYYHYKGKREGSPSIGDLLTALTAWYPPLLYLPYGTFKHALLWALNPKLLRRSYIFYMLALVQEAIENKVSDEFELDHDIQFHAGELKQLIKDKNNPRFDTAFIPYLLGVRNGIEQEKDIVTFMKQLFTLIPTGHVLVNPARNTKEFYLAGHRYFETTKYATIQDIPGITPYFIEADNAWFKTQGIAIFGLQKK